MTGYTVIQCSCLFSYTGLLRNPGIMNIFSMYRGVRYKRFLYTLLYLQCLSALDIYDLKIRFNPYPAGIESH